MTLCLFFRTEEIVIISAVLLLLLSPQAAETKENQSFAIQDTSEVNLLNQQALTFWSSKSDSTIILAEEASDKSIRLDYRRDKMMAFRNLGIGYYEKGITMKLCNPITRR